MAAKLGLFEVFAKRLDWLSQRQNVIAENIAQSDTPGYVPRDLANADFVQELRNTHNAMRTARTEGGMLPGTLENAKGTPVHKTHKQYEASPSGNAVVIEEQLVKMAHTQMDHATVTDLYSKYMKMFRMALGSNGG
ncbi:flagellar basal-body rod protein FlgB [Tistlia consotensis]|uniref:Flagellar basal body rod protein FlgB n=1 Tax=Tistlia consotensis USBA 355 TaxID=560819 RepID=A0A1Y6CK82_9PROT|nr:flagellar basal body protein [Tistlia consotensis]SMF68151.1 flagellar basal-body rod protein FlgB [Tistlia consotensis USBA 355]SNR98977.1 flagellar basal-body rod protein FlgB [Tistlia consotensis]